jgi:hypothetical protein
MADAPGTIACPKCKHSNGTAGARLLQIDLRPVLTKDWSSMLMHRALRGIAGGAGAVAGFASIFASWLAA